MFLFAESSWLSWFLDLFNKKKEETKSVNKRKKMLRESIQDFSKKTYVNQNVGIAVNHEEQKLCVSTIKDGEAVPVVYKFADISKIEIMEDGVTVPDNALNSSEDENVERLDLKISFKDSQNPFVLVNFLFWEVSKESGEYCKARTEALRWYGIIGNLI